MFIPKINLKNLQCSQFYSAGEDSILTEYLGIYNPAPWENVFFLKITFLDLQRKDKYL